MILITQTLVFTLTLMTLIYEVYNLKKGYNFSTYYNIVDRVQRMEEYIIKNTKLAKLISSELPDDGSDEYMKETTYIYYVLNFGELLFLLREKKIIDEKIWTPWRQSILRWTSNKKFQEWWLKRINLRDMYYENYRNFISYNMHFDEKIIEKLKKENAQAYGAYIDKIVKLKKSKYSKRDLKRLLME